MKVFLRLTTAHGQTRVRISLINYYKRPTHKHSNNGRDDIFHKRVDNGGKGGTHNHTNGKVNDAATLQKLLEIFNDGHDCEESCKSGRGMDETSWKMVVMKVSRELRMRMLTRGFVCLVWKCPIQPLALLPSSGLISSSFAYSPSVFFTQLLKLLKTGTWRCNKDVCS